jgi:hypothetical protein
MQQARNAAEALALLKKEQESKTRTAFDVTFGAYTVKLKKPMGFVFEELDKKAKVFARATHTLTKFQSTGRYLAIVPVAEWLHISVPTNCS